MFNRRKNKKQPRFKKAGFWGSIKGTLKDIGSVFNIFSNEHARKRTGQSIRSTQRDLWKGLGFLWSKKVLWTLTIFVLAAVGIFAGTYFLDKERQSKVHLAEATASLETKSFEDAVVSFEKVFELTNSVEPSTYVNYVKALTGQGDPKKTQEAIEKYAPGPGNVPGIKEIHRLVVFSLAQNPRRQVDLKVFKWHLECSGEIDSTEMNIAWASYHMAVGDSRAALTCFQNAAQTNPLYFDQVITLYGLSGQENLQAAAMKDAKPKLEEFLKTTPTDDKCRLLLSKILYQQGAHQSCEQLLLKGLQLTDSQVMRDAVASFNYEDYLRGVEPKSLDEALAMINSSLKLSPQNALLASVVQKILDEASIDEKGQVFELLEKATGEQSTAVTAHDMLSTFYWKENKVDRALEHAKSLFAINPDSGIANNNLAFLLGEADDPDLNRALELARIAIAKIPENGSFHDTLGTILMKMERYEEATIELKKALLMNIANKAAVHKKLAISYDKMGLKELAKKHSQN